MHQPVLNGLQIIDMLACSKMNIQILDTSACSKVDLSKL